MSDPLPRLTAALSDRYRLERELGADGMATVYLAPDRKHDPKVAVKVLRPEIAAVIGVEPRTSFRCSIQDRPAAEAALSLGTPHYTSPRAGPAPDLT